MTESRKLAAILVADVVGYSRPASVDVERTLTRLRALLGDLIEPAIAVHHGRIVKRSDDGFIAEFRSVVDAARPASAAADIADGGNCLRFSAAPKILTKRALAGIAECEHALALDRNLVDAHGFIGLGKIFTGRAEEAEVHINEALRLSPRDTSAYAWLSEVGITKNHLGDCEQAVLWCPQGDRGQSKLPRSLFSPRRRSRTAWPA
jgi:hypothetical protein